MFIYFINRCTLFNFHNLNNSHIRIHNSVVTTGYYTTVKPSAVTILGYAWHAVHKHKHTRKSGRYWFLSYTGSPFPSILRFFDQHHVTLSRIWKFLPIQKKVLSAAKEVFTSKKRKSLA